jgi:CheY-like chemotaxis protein
VILDVGLPDHTGLSVLDRIKRDVRTRHIPVHIVSVAEDTQSALASGAVGYLLKPVRREQLVEMLEGLEARMSQRMRRVLVVEDDARQADGIKQLLASREVETLVVRTARECLEKLGQETFDCMVLDLNLPDTPGLDLLEQLSADENVGFPPVIVYTGRDLSSDEELRLRRYSKSIIVKGAKSPERLLDEVTLFLHQVVSELPEQQQQLLVKSLSRDVALDGRRILVVEDDIRNVYALTSVLEPHGAKVRIARNGLEALKALEESTTDGSPSADLVLMDVMMPEMDGLTAIREIRSRSQWGTLPIIALTAKAMARDQQECLAAGANDYLAKPLDVDKLLSLVRVWMPR